jgi:hypothetical protein
MAWLAIQKDDKLNAPIDLVTLKPDSLYSADLDKCGSA